MSVIAILRSGRGRVVRFVNLTVADMHPITQYGDPIISSADEVFSNMTVSDMISSAEISAIDPALIRYLRGCDPASKSHRRDAAEMFWESAQKHANPPPADPAAIVAQITEDKLATRKTGVQHRSSGAYKMSEEQTNSGEGQTADAGEKTKRAPIPRDPKYANASIIKMGADKDGKPYGADNNPKKAGSASADRFAKYVDGMTCEQAREAGITNGDLDNDVKKGLITIS